MVSPKTIAGRKAIASKVEALAREYGAEVTTVHGWPEGSGSRDTLVRVSLRDATVGIDIGPLEASNGYIVPWNIRHDSNARFSAHFGAAVGAEVNRYHRRKCMGGYPPDVDVLLVYLRRALSCIADGAAFTDDTGA